MELKQNIDAAFHGGAVDGESIALSLYLRQYSRYEMTLYRRADDMFDV